MLIILTFYVSLNKHLSWKPHVDKIANKISKTIGIINKIKYTLPQNILIILYNSLITSHLNYCLLAWGFELKRIYKLQKKIVRIITNSNFIAHSDPLFKKLNILKIKDLFELNLLKFFYKLKKENIPYYFTNLYTRGRQMHDHNTRHCNNIRQIKYSHEFRKKSISYELSRLENSTDACILDKIHTHSYSGYIIYIKKLFIGNYPENCNLNACYVCGRQQQT